MKGKQWLLFFLTLYLRIVISELSIFENYVSKLSELVNIERCDDVWIPKNLSGLHNSFNQHLYGQPLAKDMILNALRSHFERDLSTPLILSFHGASGVGKTFVVEFIVKNLYKRGLQSNYVHSYVGSMHFPVSKEIITYEKQIQEVVTNAVKQCPQSIFIFDETHRLQPGVLNKISSLIREARLNKSGNNLRKAIFIFISNVGSDIIMNKTLKLLKSGIKREDFKLSDFESDIISAANEEGGLKNSDLISNVLIDHFIPFLPLEKEHVLRCIQKELFNMDMIYLNSEKLQEAVIQEAVTFVPEPDNTFSETGCKRISQKLSVLVYIDKYKKLSNGKDHKYVHNEF